MLPAIGISGRPKRACLKMPTRAITSSTLHRHVPHNPFRSLAYMISTNTPATAILRNRATIRYAKDHQLHSCREVNKLGDSGKERRIHEHVPRHNQTPSAPLRLLPHQPSQSLAAAIHRHHTDLRLSSPILSTVFNAH
jgi:hypothetical protein